MTTAVLNQDRSTSPDQSHTDIFRANVGQVSRHSSIFFLGTLFTAAAGYLFKIYLARVLGAEALGVYALGMTLVGFLGMFNAVGLPQSAVRFIAAYRATGKWKQIGGFLVSSSVLLVGLNVALAVMVIFVGPLLAVRFYHTPVLSAYMWLFALIMVSGALNTFYGQVLVGFKDVIRRTVITNFVSSPLTIVLTILLVTLGMGLKGYIVAQLASACVVFVVLVYSVWKLVPGAAFAGTAKLSGLPPEVVSFSTTAFGVGVVEFLMSQSDKVLIGFFIDARSVGIYAVAAAVVAFVPILLQSVNQIFSPIIADLHARGERQVLMRMFQTLTKWILGLTLPLGVMLIVFARPLMGIFGKTFESGWVILIIGTFGQLVNCGVGSVGYLLLMSGNERRLIKTQAACAALMVILNLALIPVWGIIGAAVAAAVTTLVCNCWNLAQVRSALGLWPYNRSYLRLLPAVVASLVVTVLVRWQTGNFGQHWTGAVAAVVLAYLVFAGLAIAKGLDTDDRLIIDAVLRRIRPRTRAASLSIQVVPSRVALRGRSREDRFSKTL
jgi:O-antigen/teichoic acid export membrane protein